MNSIPNLPYMHETAYEGKNKKIEEVCILVNSLVDRVNRKRDNSRSLDAYDNLVKTVSQLAQNSFRDEDVFCLVLLQSNLGLLDNYFKMIPSTMLQALPDELYKHIFSFVGEHNTLRQLSCVSKAFQNLANDNEIWQKICQQEDAEACKNKKDSNQTWKAFYKDSMFIPEFLLKEASTVFVNNFDYQNNGGSKSYAININYNHPKATIKHLKRVFSIKVEPKFSFDKIKFKFKAGAFEGLICPEDSTLLEGLGLAKCRWYIEYTN